MKEIFGSMPIDHLAAAQALANKKRNTNLILFGFAVVLVGGVIIGYKISEKRNKDKFVVKFPEPTDRLDNDFEKFKFASMNNFAVKPEGIKNKKN